MKIFHERFRDRRNRIGMYCVIAFAVIMILSLTGTALPVWAYIAAGVLFTAGIFLFISAGKGE